MADLTDDELIAWFQDRATHGQPLPEGSYRINAYTTTDNLANMVELAIGSMRRGKSIARTNLLGIKAKLEAEDNP